ncbi:hypothetical protein ES707_12824 [subsurface metagenome]
MRWYIIPPVPNSYFMCELFHSHEKQDTAGPEEARRLEKTIWFHVGD